MPDTRTASPLASIRRLIRRSPRQTEQVATVHIDAPVGPIESSSAINGWIAVDGSGTIDDIALVNAAGATIPLARFARRDVEDSMPGRSTTGFTGWIDVRTIDAGPWRVRYAVDGRVNDVPIELAACPGAAGAFQQSKQQKLAFVRNLLRCPLCKTELRDDLPRLLCAAGHAFTVNGDAFDFLDDAARADIGAIPTDNVSTHGYDPLLLDLIGKSAGPILDVGSGLRPSYRDDVVNVEIVPYPTTDVIAASEYLPFADNTFDLVISVAVLEHVRDPFAAARELQRVLRPGGRIFAAAPFLVPFHAYPNHYYNMTSAGLSNLFPGIDVEQLEVPASGGPLFALSWMLNVWRDNLPPGLAAEFNEMRVADLAVDPMKHVSAPFVRQLTSEANATIAAINVLVGRKPE